MNYNKSKINYGRIKHFSLNRLEIRNLIIWLAETSNLIEFINSFRTW